jgi:hypothetical protein
MRIKPSLSVLVVFLAAIPHAVHGQDTRGTIFGTVTDPNGAIIVGAAIKVTNIQTNVPSDVKSNESGYYTVGQIVAGSYNVEVESSGFKKDLRNGVIVQIGSRVEINFQLQIGSTQDTITVSAGSELINTDTLSSGGVLESRSALDLANPGLNTMVLAKFEPGIQSFQSIADSSVRLHSTGAASNLSIFGNSGANEYSIDGMPNNAASPAATWPAPSQSGPGPGYMPAPELVEALKVETSGFDASLGHGAGANISMMTKAGTNKWHGALRETFQNYRWNALDLFTGIAFNQRITSAQAAGNTTLAQQLISQGGHQPGRNNQYSASLGGPVILPHLYNGKDKLFFFFGWAGFRVNTYSQSYNAVPTAAMRQGDFSSLLGITVGGVNQSNLYQIFDPLSTAPDPTRTGHVVRQPFPNNIVPQSRIINPMYQFYNKLLPVPNNYLGNTVEPNQDLISYSNTGFERYDSYANRMDYNLSETNRFMLHWSWNHWENGGNTQYLETFSIPTVNSAGQDRRNAGIGLDWVHTFGPRMVLDVNAGFNDWHIWQVNPGSTKYKPSDTGLPAYMDGLGAGGVELPAVSWSGWSGLTPGLALNDQHNTSAAFKPELSIVSSHHTTKVGFDARKQFNTFHQWGSSSATNDGQFTFDSTWTRRTDDSFQNTGTGNYGGSWAAFMMGLPTVMSISNQASQVLTNPYYGFYVQDNWRLTPRLSLNYGLRIEYEFGPTERYNRMLGAFDPNATLPIAAAAQAAYAANPIAGIPTLNVQGGSTYVGVNGTPTKLWANVLEWEPRVAIAYQLGKNGVLRAGVGRYYDTFNVFSIANNGTAISQQGFSNTTTTTLSTDFGQTFLAGNPAAGVSPLTNPFPVLANGQREISAPGSALGAMGTVGLGFNFFPYDRPHTRQDRWRLDYQRQLDQATTFTIGYAGSYAQNLPLSENMAPVPAQYWSFANTQNVAVSNAWTSNVSNPYYIGNFGSLQTSNPLLYNYMANNSFFTSKTISQSKLWVPSSQMNGLTEISSLGRSKTDELDVALQRRFSRGFNFNLAYTRLLNYAADYFPNPFDRQPAWEPSNNGRPHRLVTTTVYELPFGKGRRFFQHGPLSWFLGGYQISVIQEWQPGPLLTWSSTIYYSGNPQNICKGPQTISEWFNTTGFQENSALTALTGQARVFPNEINGGGGCRAQSIVNFNTSAARKFQIREGISLDLRMDAYNAANHQQLNAPVVTPTSTQFGQITGDNTATPRAFIFYGRITF